MMNGKPTGDSSPMLRRYSVGISDDGTIGEEYVAVYFCLNDCGKVIDVCVAYRPHPVMTREDHREFAVLSNQFRCSEGNLSIEWPNGDGSLNPNGLFLDLISIGFGNHDEFIRAVREFSRIRECGWARDMLWDKIKHGFGATL